MTGTGEPYPPRLASDNLILGIVAACAAAFVVFGFLVQPPGALFLLLGFGLFGKTFSMSHRSARRIGRSPILRQGQRSNERSSQKKSGPKAAQISQN